MNLPLRLCLISLAALLAFHSGFAQAQLMGHGGPVRALAISADGKVALSGSFDTAAIRWSLATESAEQVLRFHSDAVNSVAFLKDGRMATAGADGRIAIWTSGRQQPDRIFEGHRAPIVGLAVSPDGSMLASASWDRTVRLWSLVDGTRRVLEGHTQNVNGVAFAPDGKSLASVGYDLTLRIWPLPVGAPEIIALPSPLNAVAIAPNREIMAGGADGKVRFLMPQGKEASEVQTPNPIVALAVSPDEALIAARRRRRTRDHHRPQVANHCAVAGRSRFARLVRCVFSRQCDVADGWRGRRDPALECPHRRARWFVRERHAERSAGSLCRRSRCRSIQGLCCLSYAF